MCAFSSSLTTTVFSQRSMRWFDATPRRATPKGQQSFIFHAAAHRSRSPTYIPTSPSARVAHILSWFCRDAIAARRFPSLQTTPPTLHGLDVRSHSAPRRHQQNARTPRGPPDDVVGAGGWLGGG